MPNNLRLVKSGKKKRKGAVGRVRCPEHGILTYTLIVGVAPTVNEEGRVDNRCAKRHICPQCFMAGRIRVVGSQPLA